MENAIQVTGLKKSYKKLQVLNGVDFEVEKGTIFALLGSAGLSAKSVDGAGAFSYPLIFLPFISSAFVPTESMPTAVRIFAENQPVTSIVNTLRALLSESPVENEIWVALAWCVLALFITYLFAVRMYRRKVG